MKSFKHIFRLLIFSMIALFLLVACERPTPRVPDGETQEVAPPADATAVIDEQPTTVAIPADPTPVIESTVVVEGEVDAVPEGEQPSTEGEAAEEGGAAPDVEETAVPAEEPAQRPEDGIHVVQAGDTLFKLALQYGVSVEEIAAANGLTDVDTLDIDQEVIIPEPGTVVIEPTATSVPLSEEITHIVKPGENLFRIGLQYGFTVAELADYNDIENPDQIDAGQAIRIPPQP